MVFLCSKYKYLQTLILRFWSDGIAFSWKHMQHTVPFSWHWPLMTSEEKVKVCWCISVNICYICFMWENKIHSFYQFCPVSYEITPSLIQHMDAAHSEPKVLQLYNRWKAHLQRHHYLMSLTRRGILALLEN